jgi:hypothetical protein
MSTEAVTVPRQIWYEEQKLQLMLPESLEAVYCLVELRYQ